MGVIYGLYRGYIGFMGDFIGFHRDNGKEHGHYYTILGYVVGLYKGNAR